MSESESVGAALQRALLDREDQLAASWVADNEEELWGSYVGPLLDSIQDNHGYAKRNRCADCSPDSEADPNPEVTHCEQCGLPIEPMPKLLGDPKE